MFKFDEYPEIKKCHETYQVLVDKLYEIVDGDNNYSESKRHKIFSKAREEEKKYKFNIYSKAVFDAFNYKKPILRDVWEDNKESTWNEIIGDKFKEGDEDQGRLLIGLVESEDPYILPAEYYTGKTRVEIYLEKGDF